MKKLYIAAMILLISICGTAANADTGYFGVTGTLAGTVIDENSEEPLIGVNIVFIGTRYGGTTNANGKYTIQNIPAGRYIVQFSYIGYKKYTVQWVKISSDEKTLLNVALEPGETATEEVVVTAERVKLKMDVTGTSHTVEAHQFESLPVDDFTEMIGVQPGITRDLHIRGGRKTEVQFLVDGLPFTEAAGGAVGGMIPKSAIQEMRVMTGGFEAEYGNAMSGVINIVTKPGEAERRIKARVENDYYGFNPETNKESLGELYIGGPLTKKINWFTSSDFRAGSTRWHEDFEKFFSGPVMREFNNVTKFDWNHTGNRRFSFLALTSYKKSRDYEYRWRMNLPGLPENRRFSNRISVAYTQFLTENTFINLNLSQYYLNARLGPEDKENMNPDDLWEYDFRLRFVRSGTRAWWARDEQTQWTVKGDLTTKPYEEGTIKFGFQLTYYNMDIERIKSEPEMSLHGTPLVYKPPLDYSTSYNYKPRSGTVFFQNKIVLLDEGTVSFGLRYDFIDPRASRPNLEWVPTGNDDFEKQITEWVPAKVKHHFSPRMGFGIPVSTKTLFLVNFGHFYQVPLFDHLYSGLDINLKKKNAILVGNPDMEPMITRQHEYILRHEIKDGIDFSFTWFRKKTENLVDTKTFIASDSKFLDDGYFGQYVNSPFAEATGVELILEKYTTGPIYGKLSYTIMEARGIAETRDQSLRYLQWGFEPMNTMYPLSWDQRHTFNAVISTRPGENTSLDFIANYHSARPYTYYPSDTGVVEELVTFTPNNSRMKSCLYVDLKAKRKFAFNQFGLKQITAYVDIRNLFDKKNILWIASDGRIGGELRDPGAYDMPRRTRLGLEFTFR